MRCERPTSAKPGAKALIRGDGAVTGWVGGACAEPVVVREALKALRDGQPRLVALVGEGGAEARRAEGLVPYPMTCHSGGTLEIYVEPFVPKPLLVLVGHGPVLETLAALGRATDFDVMPLAIDAAHEELARLSLGPSASVVVGTHGSGDEEALEQILSGGAGHVSLIASRKRAAAISRTLAERGVADDRIRRLHAPAGLDIGATTPAEIAVSILAEVIQHRRSDAAAGRRASRRGRAGCRCARRRTPCAGCWSRSDRRAIARRRRRASPTSAVSAARKPSTASRATRFAAIRACWGRSRASCSRPGLSRRMGRAKLLLPLDGRPVVRHAAEGLLAAGVEPLSVVVGPDGEAVTAALADLRVQIVVNPHPEAGQASSLVAGIAALPPGTEAVIVALGDQPFVPADVIRELIYALRRQRQGHRGAAVPRRAGQSGAVPGRRLPGAPGASAATAGRARWWSGMPARVALVEVDRPMPEDVDTPDDYARLRSREEPV